MTALERVVGFLLTLKISVATGGKVVMEVVLCVSDGVMVEM